MAGWNFAEVWEVVAEQIPDATAQVQGDRRFTWADFDRRANGIGRTLLEAGAQEDDKVALYLYNGPEYLETMFGVWKAGLTPINSLDKGNAGLGPRQLLAVLWDGAETGPGASAIPRAAANARTKPVAFRRVSCSSAAGTES